MRCPSLKDLPPPPLDKTGWPWTVENPQLPDCMPNGKPWPKITIVTPSFNQGNFIEETIRSILLQGYPDLEYIIIDGGSSDDSVKLIQKYGRWIAYWVSEKDGGQADAIQKGIYHSSGEIFNWINSDDLLTQQALEQVMLSIGENDILCGEVINFRDSGTSMRYDNRNLSYRNLLLWENDICYQQPGCWLKLEILEKIGGLQTDLHYVFDYEMMLRYLRHTNRIAYLNKATALFRLHGESKTVSQSHKFNQETYQVLNRHTQSLEDVEFKRVLEVSLSERRIRDDWYHTIEQISNSMCSRSRKLLSLTLGIAQSPARRLNRFSLGALRRIALRK